MASPVRRRTRAREMALQFLYSLDLRGEEAFEELDAFLERAMKHDPDRKGHSEVTEYGERLIRGSARHMEELNTWIERIASNWRLERMAVIDRNILRMAIYELLYERDVPFKVVINEAIDIAKRFSTPQSGSFVNGILDRARVLIEGQRADGIETPQPPETPAASAVGAPETLPPAEPPPVPRPRSSRPASPQEG